jgi:DNA primase
LKKKGREYMACCPFHSEKTPSFTVSPQKQFYHCFGCGAHGNAIGFLMDYDHLEFVDAIEALAQNLGLEVPREGRSAPRAQYTDDFKLLTKASEFYKQALRHHSPAVDYLKARGLTGQIAMEYALGYAPAAWDPLTRYLQPFASQEQMANVGLTVKSDDGRYYDRFRNRIMFPIKDRRGRVIGFGARLLGEGTPKYLNSPETPLFHKGRALYGWFEARKAKAGLDSVLVVEGYMDVVALAQYGVRNAVATLGTATTREHIQQLYRNVSEIVFCFDGDRAGRAAAWRAVENLLPEFRDGLQARFVFLPEGEDPDSLIRKEGQSGWSERIDQAVTFDAYILSYVQQGLEIVGAGARAQLAQRAKPLLRLLRDGVFKERLAIELAKLTGVSLERMLLTARADPVPLPSSDQGQPHIHGSPVRLAIALLLTQPRLADEVGRLDKLKVLDLPGISLLVEIIEILQSNPHLNSASLIERYRDSKNHPHLLKLMQWRPLDIESGNLQPLFADVIAKLVERQIEQRADRLLHKARREGLNSDEKLELRRLLHDSPSNRQLRNPQHHES